MVRDDREYDFARTRHSDVFADYLPAQEQRGCRLRLPQLRQIQLLRWAAIAYTGLDLLVLYHLESELEEPQSECVESEFS